MSLPCVYAFAPRLRAESAAALSVWTRTRLKSWSNLASMSERKPSSSGTPGEVSGAVVAMAVWVTWSLAAWSGL